MLKDKRMIRKSILVDQELWKTFKVFVIQNNLKITDCINEAFVGFLKQREVK